MSTDSDTSTNEMLSDLQRIELLEKTGKLNRLLIYGLSGGLVLALLAILLVGLLGGGSEAEEAEKGPTLASVKALEERLASLEQQVAPLKQQVQNQQALFNLLKGGLPAPTATPAPAATGAAPASTESDKSAQETKLMVARTLIGQEQSYQKTITALKSGMRDLAGMIAGSRSWLEDYESDLNKPLAESQARAKALQQWANGKPASATE
ncbi:hypothetical protein [Aquipseudomonas guryensis]|jgi:hypothetical protein|uniref:Uncharacterized protein n=1 Tax=Aquipseudomonas guryensis TaxID=2759165 RepID=A0A7W4H4I7_9GAMM|nr:hypothetical protein [Pseudomonas guryensis]MBB1520691.1 hypothetical protein [Pseudomonas guryensis]